MMYDSDDALDRALFALPLEEPPAEPARRRSWRRPPTARQPAFVAWEVAVTRRDVAAHYRSRLRRADCHGRRRALRSLACDTIGSTFATRALQRDSTLAWLAAGGDDGLLALDFSPDSNLSCRGRIARFGRKHRAANSSVDGEVAAAATPTV